MLGLSNKEFINRLDLESTDPVIRRLLAIINDDTIRVELEEAGMDPVDCLSYRDWETDRKSTRLNSSHRL